MLKMNCPRCGDELLTDRNPWVLGDDDTGRTRVFNNDNAGEPDPDAERHRCA